MTALSVASSNWFIYYSVYLEALYIISGEPPLAGKVSVYFASAFWQIFQQPLSHL